MSAIGRFRAWYESEEGRAFMNRVAKRNHWSADTCRQYAIEMADWLETAPPSKANKTRWDRFWSGWIRRNIRRIQSRKTEQMTATQEAAHYKGHRRHEGGGEITRLGEGMDAE